MKVAVIGSGISGLAAAHRLREHARVTLFEGGRHFGGHTHTVDVSLPDARRRIVSHGVDIGFLVFNRQAHLGLTALLHEVQVPTASTDMSMSVRVPGAGALGASALEWSNANLVSVFAQRRNLLRPRFLGMLAEFQRFNLLCSALSNASEAQHLSQPLGDFLQHHDFSDSFRDWYLLPMLSTLWTCPSTQMLRLPIAIMLRFCRHHGWLQANKQSQWHTISGGARQYVDAITQGLHTRLATTVTHIVRNPMGVFVRTSTNTERFDAVVLAVHSNQALHMLAQPSADEQRLLGAIRYQSNRIVLHTDTRVMPQRKTAWAAWNYEHTPDDSQARVCLHQWLNRFQPLPFAQALMLSHNPINPIDPRYVLWEFDAAQPVFDGSAVAAQQNLSRIQGRQRTWFAGAWTGDGLHEDGLQSGYRAADALLAQLREREAA